MKVIVETTSDGAIEIKCSSWPWQDRPEGTLRVNRTETGTCLILAFRSERGLDSGTHYFLTHEAVAPLIRALHTLFPEVEDFSAPAPEEPAYLREAPEPVEPEFA